MAYINIQSFKFGLDARKSEQTSQPGTLVKLENAHVNQGGEVSKRFKFSRFYSADLAGTIGMKFTSQGAVVFGSAATPATLVAWPTFGTPAGFSFPVSYMQLVHPDGTTAIDSIVSACVFGDVPFVSAKFADGTTYTYYNGLIVTDLIAGVIANFMKTGGVVDNDKIARHLEALVNNTAGYTAAQNASFADASDITGTSGPSFSVAATATVAGDGSLIALANSAGTPAVQGQGATGSFFIYQVVATTGQISSIKYGTTELLLSAVAANSSADVNQMAQDVCRMINSNSASGFTAFASGNLVTISADSTTAATLTVTASQCCVGDYNAIFSGNDLNITALQIAAVGILTGAQYAFPQLVANIASITHAGSTNTINTTANHNLVTGAKVSIAGCTNALNNQVNVTITRTSATQFTVTNASGVAQPGAAGTATLTTSYNLTGDMVDAIAADINAGGSGYTAVSYVATDSSGIAIGFAIAISKAISASTDSNLAVAWTFTGTGNISGSGGNSLNASVASNYEGVAWNPVSGGFGDTWQLSTGLIACKVSGGTPPYTYTWTLLSSSGAYPGTPGFTAKTAASTKLVIASFQGTVPPQLKSGQWTIQCNVKDSLNAPTSTSVITCSTGV